MDFPKRGEVWFVSLEPVVGHEIGKTRPALVISNDRNNLFAETVTVLLLLQKQKKSIHLKSGSKREKATCPKAPKSKQTRFERSTKGG